jgi:hypothetical protein
MSDTKLDQAVFQILRLTHEDKLAWESKRPSEIWRENTDDVYPIYFETWYNGRKLALFRKRSRVDEHEKYVARMMNEPVDDWTQSLHLALLGGNDEILFEFPWSPQVSDLFQAVRYKEANVDEFVEALLNPKATGEK